MSHNLTPKRGAVVERLDERPLFNTFPGTTRPSGACWG